MWKNRWGKQSCGALSRVLRPLVFGDYPQVMKNIVGSRLPSFTKAQSEDVKGSLDFIGMNHYYSLYVNDRPLGKGTRDFVADMSIYYRGKNFSVDEGIIGLLLHCTSPVIGAGIFGTFV